MRSISILLVPLLLACSTPPGDDITPDSGEEPVVVPEERALVEPGNLAFTESSEGLTLTWEDRSVKEEGYLVRKKTTADGKVSEAFLPANSSSWTDTGVKPGETVYTVQSYWHMDRSPEASVTYTRYSRPELEMLSFMSSWHMVAAGVKILSDGGEPVRCGVAYSKKDATENIEVVFQEKLSTGATGYILAEDLERGVEYLFRPWAENVAGRTYGTERTASLQPLPEAVSVSWEDISGGSAPAGLSVLKGSTDAFGHLVNLWCAVADLSGGNLELRTTMATSLTEPGTYIRETLSAQGPVRVLVNGGYFASPAASYSYVCDRGVKKASNVSQLSRTRSYSVTRGFFGVDAAGKTAIGWNSGDSFYTHPLPVFDGGPELPAGTGLETISDWTPYSAIGGGPVLVKDGAYCFDYLKSSGGFYLSNHELFQTDIFASGLRAPRTAIGSCGDGRIVLLVADGRGMGGSTGLTLDELARVMTGLGCTDVLNLDGGGSSMFLVGPEGALLNQPSDGHQRKILSFVSIMEKE